MSENLPIVREALNVWLIVLFLALAAVWAFLIAREWLRNLTTDLRAFVLSRFRPTSSRPERN